MRVFKVLATLLFLIISDILIAQTPNIDSASIYNKRAMQCFQKNDFTGSFFWYEELFKIPLRSYQSNYNFYRTSVSACQINKRDKALYYFNKMVSNYLDYNNYPYFANDTLAKCLKETVEWRNAMSYMKPKYDSVLKTITVYNDGINDKNKRLNKSELNDSTYLKKLFVETDINKIYHKLKSYNNYPTPPALNHWTLYELKVNDTLTVPFLVYVPNNYKPKRKTPLYVFLRGGVTNMPVFNIEDNIPEFHKSLLINPIKQNTFIIIPFYRKDINWLFHPLSFETIDRELAFVKSLYNIDDNRVFMTGHSDGGRGSFYFAINQPNNFASFLSINYFPKSNITNTSLRNLRNTETLYGISGTKDFLFSYKKIDSIYNYGKSIGDNWENYTFDEGHTLPYDTADLINFAYDTIITKVRNPFPKKIEWETDNVINGRYKWIQISKLDTASKKAVWAETYNPNVTGRDNLTIENFNKNKTGIIKAFIKGNEVTVITSCVREFNFYVYPELIDISKPIIFNINKKTFLKVNPKANKNNLASEFTKTKDRITLTIAKITIIVED